MREVKITCDKCGKNIKYKETIKVIHIKTLKSYDLCEECYPKFQTLVESWLNK